MTPTEMNIDALMEKIEKLEIINSAMIDTPTFNKLSNELAMVKAENARYREALELIIKQFPKDYEVRITEIASEALKEIESNSRAIQIGKDLSEFKIRELESKLAKAKEALEFYADGEIVIAQKTDPKFSEIEKEMELLSDDFDVSVENGYWVKGKRARQALKGE